MAWREAVTAPLIRTNPVTVQVLGLCSALAITQSLLPALVMASAVTCVLAFSNLTISLIRRWIPSNIRLILQITIISSAVIITDEFIITFLPDVSAVLSVFVGLIVTNCIVLGRTEGYALTHSAVDSFFDGIGNGIGYSIVLIMVATFRELFGQGTLLAEIVFPLLLNDGWYLENQFLALPASAFLIIGALVWIVQTKWADSDKSVSRDPR